MGRIFYTSFSVFFFVLMHFTWSRKGYPNAASVKACAIVAYALSLFCCAMYNQGTSPLKRYAIPIPCWQEKAEMCKMLLMLLTQCFVVGLVLWWNSKTFNAMSSILRIYSSIDASLVVSQNDIRWTSRLPLHIPTPFSFWRPWVIAEFVFGRWYKAPPPINHAHPWHRSSALLRPVETHKRFVL